PRCLGFAGGAWGRVVGSSGLWWNGQEKTWSGVAGKRKPRKGQNRIKTGQKQEAFRTSESAFQPYTSLLSAMYPTRAEI
nr:hypothetical protein [Tanacetum cinerariifolium]